MDRLAERDPEPLARLITGVPRRAQIAVFAQHEPDESRAILGVAQALRDTPAAGNPCFDPPGFIGGAMEDPHR